MLGYIFAVIVSRVVATANKEIVITERAMARIDRAKNHAILCIEGIEVHIFLVYLYPHTYPAIDVIGRLLGVSLAGFKYH